MNDKHVLTRALIEAGGIDAIVARDAPGMRLLTLEERTESLRSAIAARPPGDAWLFGYGSLIWNPTIQSIEHRTARIKGWHRTFCLSTQAGRGSKENPGLVLALDAGGECTGIAFRIAEEVLAEELSIVWRREMLSGAYVPRWLDVTDEEGLKFGSALAFTINPMCEHYVGKLSRDAIVECLATAFGALGSAAEYLFQTRDGLRFHGIPDKDLECLAASVEAHQAAHGPRSR